MFYKILFAFFLIIIVLFTIGYQGVRVDSFMDDATRNEFLLKYGLIIFFSLIFSILIYFKKIK